MPKLRNPGPWSFAIFLSACALVGFLHWRGVPEAAKLAGSLIGVAVAAFGAKSALGTRPTSSSSEPPPRAPMHTWPGEDEEPPTPPAAGGGS